eukprot:362948-Chlamydomonas_euryale.AAC.2
MWAPARPTHARAGVRARARTGPMRPAHECVPRMSASHARACLTHECAAVMAMLTPYAFKGWSDVPQCLLEGSECKGHDQHRALHQAGIKLSLYRDTPFYRMMEARHSTGQRAAMVP